ncbi:unnamed protein product [Lepeophtheirus salmonis]|uniref:(salmon louse) hypothetical protein n=1 Tax=Lepeophtheirus salmonis TaxID=72036 RepID=A0A7R8D7L3_LEPSM|nr:unnamed protein product [Lepeophtheirus salmonis]CAF3026747.1 unnamed protein product [Lepeophtheirus salmonis]
MDEQVEAYREEGKTEAASRLEDQLNLIHSRFRELAMKFELFQRQSASEYSLVLDRVSRELRDISSQLSLAELRSWDTTDVGKNHPSDDGNEELTCRIDALKIEFNQVGSQITESRTVLEKALKLSEKLRLSMHNVEMGLTADSIPEESNLCDSEEDLYLYLKNKVSEMIKLKDDLRSILQIKSDLISLSLHGPIDEAFINLQKRVDAIESRWKDMVNFLSKIHHELKKSHDVFKYKSNLPFKKCLPGSTLWKQNYSKKQTQNGSGYDESKCLELGQEIESLRPEMSNLREMAIKLVVMFVGKKGDVEPEMRSLGQRWDDIVRTVEERLAQNKEIPTPSSIVSSSNNTKKTLPPLSNYFSPDSEMDSEEIVTLPEDDDEMVSSCSSSSHHIPSPSKKDETKKIISSLSIIPSSNKRGVKSLPVTSVLSTTTTTTNGSEKVKVKVCINTLPSPQKAVKSPVTINSQVPFNKAKTGALMIWTKNPPLLVIMRQSKKLLNDTNNHIQELKSKSTSYHSSRYNSSSSSSSSSAGILEKESTDFANSKKNIMSKISKAKGKIMDLDREADIKLRLDLIEMESQMIEAEVATLISRGDTLVLMTHRNDISKAEALQKDVSELRESWADIRSLCERKKAQAASLEKKLEEFKESADEIKSWISSFKSTRNVRQSPVFSRKKLEVDSLNNLGSTLKRQNVLGVNALNLSLINSKWDYLLNGSTRTPSKNETALLSNKSPRQRASDSQKEIATILEKLIDAVNVISRQMNNQFLSSPRIYENLLGQRKSLETVRSAIERIGPTVRKTESDVEGLNGRDGGLSVEYYDKILVLGEKLRKSWMDLNSKYLQRHEIWKVCSRNSDTFGKDIIELNKCFDISHPSVSQAKLSEKQKEITNVTSLGKEIIGQTSKHIESDPPPSVPSDKVIPSIDDTLSYLQKPVNVSSLNQVSHAIEKLDTIQKSFLESKEDQDKSSSSKIEKLTPILSKKLSYLSERKSKLEKFKQKIEAAHTWVEDMSRKLSDVAKQKMKGSRSEVISRIRLAVIDKEYEVNRLLNEYMILEREVSMQQEVDPELRKSVDSFKIAWKKLTSESRRISTEGSTSRETSPMVRHNNKSSDSSSMKEGPSYGSMIPLSEEVAPFSLTLEPSMSELDIWLDSIASEISGNVAPVHDNESVKELITRITFYLHDLEIKRPFIDDLMTNSSNLAREENQMKMKIKSLRDHWDSVKCLLLSRKKTELMSMSTESDQFKRKSMEMNTGLKRIEEKLAKINRNSSTLPSFYHQFNSFSSFCRRISSVYSKDDTSKINEFEGSILSKYQELEASVNENHDSLQTSKSVLTNYDSSKKNEDIRREPSKLLSKLSLLKEDISSKNPEFTSILSTGESISHGMTHTESGMLRQRGDEMSLRVKALTNKVDHLNEFLLQSKEEINSSSSPNKENFSSSSRCNGDVIPEEEEEGSLLRWIEKKRKEIRSLSMKSDLSGLKKQLEEHEAFEKRITEEKEGRSPHGLGSLKENQEWNTLKTDIEEWRTRLLERIRDLKMFQNDFESLTSRLAAVEETRSLWNEEEEEEDSLLETTDITTLAKNKDPRSKIDPHKNDDDIKNIAKQEENMKNRLNMKK